MIALHVGYMDTDMTAGIDVPKPDPITVADQTLDGVESDPTKSSPTTSADTTRPHRHDEARAASTVHTSTSGCMVKVRREMGTK